MRRRCRVERGGGGGKREEEEEGRERRRRREERGGGENTYSFSGGTEMQGRKNDHTVR